MIDIQVLRQDPERVKANCRRRGAGVDVDAVHEKDQQYLALTREVEEMRAERNRLSKASKSDPQAREKVRELKQDIANKEQERTELKNQVQEALGWVPNFLADDVPDGDSDEDNVELRVCGEKPDFSFRPREHYELGEMLGIIDTDRGSKVAQAGFYYWVGKGAELANALFFWAQKELVRRGFISVVSPCLAKPRTLYGSGYLPFFQDEVYNIENEELALIGTSEQTLIGYHADETLDAAELPLCYTAFSPCFRTEAGSHGKATRGIFRVHQFHKVEQIIFCTPDDSPKYHEYCLDNEEDMLRQLGIPYHVVNVCTGDLGAPGYKKYDIEAWFPVYSSRVGYIDRERVSWLVR